MSRNGKIARLDEDLRNELNQRLADGLEGGEILSWLNELPEVKEVLKMYFDEKPISKQNLSEWRRGGYQEWQIREDLLRHAVGAGGCADQIRAESEGLLIDKVAVVLAARYAALLAEWDGQPGEAVSQQVRLLGELCSSVARLQRNTHRAAEHQYELEKLEKQKEASELEERRAMRMEPIQAAQDLANLTQLHGNTLEAELNAAEIVGIKYGYGDAEIEELKAAIREQAAGRSESHPVALGQTEKNLSSQSAGDQKEAA